jgi:hypothetical protein
MTKATPKTITYNAKRLKEVDKAMRLGMKEFDKMTKRPPLSPAERRELRAEQQRARRASKTISEVVL